MKHDSGTPRTDANEWTPNGLPSVVEAEFARTLEREAVALRADRDALAAALTDATVFIRQAAEMGILNPGECAPLVTHYKQALSKHGGK